MKPFEYEEPMHPEAEKWYKLYQEEVEKRTTFLDAIKAEREFCKEIEKYLERNGKTTVHSIAFGAIEMMLGHLHERIKFGADFTINQKNNKVERKTYDRS